MSAKPVGLWIVSMMVWPSGCFTKIVPEGRSCFYPGLQSIFWVCFERFCQMLKRFAWMSQNDHAVVSPKSGKLDFPGVKWQLCCVAWCCHPVVKQRRGIMSLLVDSWCMWLTVCDKAGCIENGVFKTFFKVQCLVGVKLPFPLRVQNGLQCSVDSTWLHTRVETMCCIIGDLKLPAILWLHRVVSDGLYTTISSNCRNRETTETPDVQDVMYKLWFSIFKSLTNDLLQTSMK